LLFAGFCGLGFGRGRLALSGLLILRAGGVGGKKSEAEKTGKNRPVDAPHKDTSLAKRSKGGDAPIAQFPGPNASCYKPRDSRYGSQNQTGVRGLPEICCY
jgi:hypothetical protein